MTGSERRVARPGFTLIELLIVVVILGILAAIGILNTRSVQTRAYRSTIEADLKLLATQQELYHQLHMRYASLAELADYSASDGVTVGLGWLAPQGFAATATHAARPDVTCGYFVGEAPEGSAGSATTEGRITCN